MGFLEQFKELIWLFVAGGILMYTFPEKQERLLGRTVRRWDYLPAIILVLPLTLWAGFRGDVADTYLYRKLFMEESRGLMNIPEILLSDGKDKGFTALTIFLKYFIGNSDKLYFTIFAVFQMACMCYVFRKYSSDFWISVFLFVASTDYASWMFNGMRQFIAVCLIFSCFDWIVQKKYVRVILVILLASLMHGSALLMIPIIFVVQGKPWNMRTILMLIGTAVVVLFIDRFTPILSTMLEDTQYDGVMENEIWVVDDGTNVIRVLVYSVPAIISLFGRKYLDQANNTAVNICVNCSIVTAALYAVSAVTSGVYIGRLPIYTSLMGYISLPWLINHMFNRESSRLVKVVMVVLYIAFYCYQTFITW
jgi:transmembrane protein EpsG